MITKPIKYYQVTVKAQIRNQVTKKELRKDIIDLFCSIGPELSDITVEVK